MNKILLRLRLVSPDYPLTLPWVFHTRQSLVKVSWLGPGIHPHPSRTCEGPSGRPQTYFHIVVLPYNNQFLSFFCFNSSTYSSHCSNHSGFSLFSLTDVWNFSLPSPMVTKASFVPIQNFIKDRLNSFISFQFNFEEKSILFTNIYWEIINQYSFTIFAFYIESLGSPHWKINAFINFSVQFSCKVPT